MTLNPLSLSNNIYICISPIKGPHKIIQVNPCEIVTTSETIVYMNENQGFVNKIKGIKIIIENLNKSYNLE